MIIEKHYVLCALFVLLLTIVLWGMGKVVIKMAFNKLSEDKAQSVLENKSKISALMVLPQIIMLLIVFVLGVYVPPFLNNIINCTIAGF